MVIWIIVLVVVLGGILFAILLYNKLVRNKNMVEEGWSGIEVQLKRRSNLIPNLIETVNHRNGKRIHGARVRTSVRNRKTQIQEQRNPGGGRKEPD